MFAVLFLVAPKNQDQHVGCSLFFLSLSPCFFSPYPLSVLVSPLISPLLPLSSVLPVLVWSLRFVLPLFSSLLLFILSSLFLSLLSLSLLSLISLLIFISSSPGIVIYQLFSLGNHGTSCHVLKWSHGLRRNGNMSVIDSRNTLN